MLTEEIKDAIRKLQARYPEKRSALIPALHLVQHEVGYLHLEVQKEVAELFGIDVEEVHGIVTFYDMFFEKPVGKHLIHICKNASCMLRGCDRLIECLSNRPEVKSGEFTLIQSECLGACDKAPMMLVDEKVVGPVHEQEIDTIFEEAKKGKGHPSPITLEEVKNG